MADTSHLSRRTEPIRTPSRSQRSARAVAERVAKTGARSFAAASAVCDHRLSNPGRSLRRFRSRDHAGAGSDGLKGDWSGNVRAASQLRSEADRTYARNSLGARVGPALAAGNGDVRGVCLEWPDL